MTTPNALPPSPEIQFPPEEPGPFRIGEIVVARGFIGENGELLLERGKHRMQKRVVIDVYQGFDTSKTLITSMLTYDETGFGVVGSTDLVEQTVSLGEIMPRDKLIEFTLQKKYGSLGREVFNHDNPLIRGLAKLFVLDIVEQTIADKIAHGEPVTEAELAINHNRRLRDTETGSYLMGSAVRDPVELADLDVEALLHSSDSQ